MNKEIIKLDEYRRNEGIVSGNNALDLEIREKHYYYDVRRTDPKVIAKAFTEERVTLNLKERITISDLYPENRIEKDDWNYNEHSEDEKEATANVFCLGKKGYNLVVWISPDDEGKVYKEGRLNIHFPVFGENEWALYGRHVPLLYNRNDSYKLARRLLENNGVSMESITDAEGVRRQPIGFKIENIDNWIEECKKLMPEFIEVWDFIESGGDVKNKIKMEKDVVIAMKKANGDNYLFESIMARMGNKINAEGGHGSSWGGGETIMIVTVNANGELSYYMHSGSREGLTFCSKCGCWYSGEKCPNPKCH
jgi:hypothetical protein